MVERDDVAELGRNAVRDDVVVVRRVAREGGILRIDGRAEQVKGRFSSVRRGRGARLSCLVV